MVNINKTVIKNELKELGIERVSASTVEALVNKFLHQTKIIGEEALNVLEEKKQVTLSPEILNIAINNLKGE
jgi:histone H3/H4